MVCVFFFVTKSHVILSCADGRRVKASTVRNHIETTNVVLIKYIRNLYFENSDLGYLVYVSSISHLPL